MIKLGQPAPGTRKFRIAILSMLLAEANLVAGLITGPIWFQVMVAVLGLYGLANVVSKFSGDNNGARLREGPGMDQEG